MHLTPVLLLLQAAALECTDAISSAVAGADLVVVVVSHIQAFETQLDPCFRFECANTVVLRKAASHNDPVGARCRREGQTALLSDK